MNRQVSPNPDIDSAREWPVAGSTDGSNEISRRKFIIGAGVGVAALIGAGIGGGFLLGKNSGESAPATEPAETNPTEPTETDPVVVPETKDENNSEAETELSYEEKVAALEIEAGLDAEELATTFVADRLTQWLNAGCEDDLNVKTIGQTYDEALPPIAEENAELFADALFIDNWERKTDLAAMVEKAQKQNLAGLGGYTSTQWNTRPENLKHGGEGFKSWYTVGEATETINDDGTRTLKIKTTQHNNADKNLYADRPDGQISNPNFTYTVTFRQIDGKEKVSAISSKLG